MSQGRRQKFGRTFEKVRVNAVLLGVFQDLGWVSGPLKGEVRERFDRTLSVVLKTLSLGFYRTFSGAKSGFDGTFWGSIQPF